MHVCVCACHYTVRLCYNVAPLYKYGCVCFGWMVGCFVHTHTSAVIHLCCSCLCTFGHMCKCCLFFNQLYGYSRHLCDVKHQNIRRCCCRCCYWCATYMVYVYMHIACNIRKKIQLNGRIEPTNWIHGPTFHIHVTAGTFDLVGIWFVWNFNSIFVMCLNREAEKGRYRGRERERSSQLHDMENYEHAF